MMTEKQYWDKAAKDRDVDIKYISDVDDTDCLIALAPVGAAIEGVSVAHVLEIGSGVGRLTSKLADRFIDWKFYGIDISPNMIALANKRHRATNLEYKLTNGVTIPYDDGFFHAAYTMLTFQHIDSQNLMDYFYEVSRVLKKNGTFRFQFVEGNHHDFVNHNHDTFDVKRWLGNAGFEIKTIENGLVHPQWTWITAVKK